MKWTPIVNTICFLLIFLFTYTAASKLLNLSFFSAQLTNFPVLKNAASFISWFLPMVELSVVTLLMISKFRLKGLIASLALLVLFTVYLLAMVISGITLPCTCGGVLIYMTWKQHIVFNLFFIIIALIGIAQHKRSTEIIGISEKKFSS